MPLMPCRAAERFTPELRLPTNGETIINADCVSLSQTREVELPQKICPACGTRSLPPKARRATALDLHWLKTPCRNTMVYCASAAAPGRATAERYLAFSYLAIERYFRSNCPGRVPSRPVCKRSPSYFFAGSSCG